MTYSYVYTRYRYVWCNSWCLVFHSTLSLHQTDEFRQKNILDLSHSCFHFFIKHLHIQSFYICLMMPFFFLSSLCFALASRQRAPLLPSHARERLQPHPGHRHQRQPRHGAGLVGAGRQPAGGGEVPRAGRGHHDRRRVRLPPRRGRLRHRKRPLLRQQHR